MLHTADGNDMPGTLSYQRACEISVKHKMRNMIGDYEPLLEVVARQRKLSLALSPVTYAARFAYAPGSYF